MLSNLGVIIQNNKSFTEEFREDAPAFICLFLMLMIFTSRLSLSLCYIGMITSLVLIVLTVPFKNILCTAYQHPIARAAAIFYACLIIGTFYSHVAMSEQSRILRHYLPLLWITFLIAFLQTSFPQLATRFTRKKTETYSSVFMYGAVLAAILGCLNAWHVVNVSHLIHSHLTTDPLEYPFGTFSFSLSFAAYLSVQKMKYATTRLSFYCYLVCFLILCFFIFFVSHQRTAYILTVLLLLIFGYQHIGFKGFVSVLIALALLLLTAYNTSTTFHQRTSAVVLDLKQYSHGHPNSSTGLRLFFIKASYDLWKQKPFFGYGTGSFKSTYLTIDGYNVNGHKNTAEMPLDQPHNEYAYIAVQLGLFGLFFLLWLFFKQFVLSFKLPIFEKQCAQAFILSFMVGALDTSLLFYATSIIDYFFFSALLYAPLARKNE